MGREESDSDQIVWYTYSVSDSDQVVWYTYSDPTSDANQTLVTRAKLKETRDRMHQFGHDSYQNGTV